MKFLPKPHLQKMARNFRLPFHFRPKRHGVISTWSGIRQDNQIIFKLVSGSVFNLPIQKKTIHINTLIIPRQLFPIGNVFGIHIKNPPTMQNQVNLENRRATRKL